MYAEAGPPPTPEITRGPNRLQRAVCILLWLSLSVSLVVATVAWIKDGRLWNETVITSRLIPDAIAINGKPAPIHWIDRYPENFHLWQWLLLGWFYPAKILLQVQVTDRRRQLLWYTCLVLVAILWIWTRLVTWTWWYSETVEAEVIGEPVSYLFVPSCFFVLDWLRRSQHSAGYLVVRMVVELLLLFPWLYIWSWTQLLFGWYWI